jgi:regulatory protein
MTTVVSVKIPVKSGSSIRRIALSDGSQFSFSIAYLSPDFEVPEPGGEVSPACAAALRDAAGCYRAERAALQFIARAEQCRTGLARKLNRKGLESLQVAAALDQLERLEILSDERFAEMWFRAKLRPALSGRRGKASPRKLAASLMSRGISVRIAQKVMKQMLDAESEAALLKSYVAAAFPLESTVPDVRRRLRAEGFSTASVRFWEEEHA